MKKFKQLSAFFLALAMVLSLFPVLGHTHAHAEETTPATMQEGDNVIVAQEGEHWNAWTSGTALAAFWMYHDTRGQNVLYLMYPEQETKALTVNGVAVTAGQDSSSRDYAIVNFDDLGVKVDDYSDEVYIEMTGAYEWSGWVLLRKDVVVREGGATINSGNATQYCNEDKYVIPSGAGHVIDLTLNITAMPAYKSFDKAPMVYFATKSTWNTTGIAISFTDELHTADADSSYQMLLVKSDADNHLYAAIARASGDGYGSKAYDLGIVIDGETAQTVNLRWETVPQADGTYTSYLYANGRFICARENTRITSDTATGMNKCVFIRPWAKRNADGDTTAYNFTGTLNRYYADAYTPTAAALDNLTADMLLGENESADAVTSNLTLPAYVREGSINGNKLAWTATGAVDAEGVVDTENGGAATLTATIEGTELSKTFNFTVVKAACEHEGGTADCQNLAICTKCGEPYGELGDHTPGAEADCENAQTCTVCGDTLNAALGHKYEDKDGKAPTCNEAGWTAYQECSVCHDIVGKTELGVTDEHDYVEIDRQEATCVAPGFIKEECSVCGDIRETPIEIDEDAHDYEDKAGKAPTCNEAGWTEYQECALCGDIVGKTELGATGNHNYEVVETVNATCVAPGNIKEECSVCGDIRNTPIEIDEDAHDIIPHDAKDPTCTEIGWDAYETCSRCDYSTYVEKAALNHSFTTKAGAEITPADCENAAVHKVMCDRCDVETAEKTVTVGEALGHSFTTKAGAEITPADCNNAAVHKVMCDRCDVETAEKTVTVGTALGHNFADTLTQGETTHYYECSRCDAIDGEAEHIWENEFDDTCDACGKTRVAAEAVAMIGNTPYASLDEAIQAAVDGDEIVLKQSISGPGLKIEKDITIDFGGNTYTFTDPATGSVGTTTLGMQILEGYDVILKNGTLKVDEEYEKSYAVLIQNYADLTISGMTLDGTQLDRFNGYDYSYVVSVNCGTVLIENTTIIANDEGDDIALTLDKYNNGTRDYPAPEVTLNNVTVDDGVIRINGATVVINSGNYTGNGSNGLIAIESGNLTINGGTFDAALGEDGYSMALWAKGGETTINGGLFKNKADFEGDPTHGSDLIYAKFDAYVEITGGTFEAADERWALNLHGQSPDALIVVKGGSFKGFNPNNNNTENPQFNYLATGYVAVKNGEYYVVEAGTYAATIGSVGYLTLEEAVAAAKPGDVIELLKSVTVTETLNVDNITINGNGNTISAAINLGSDSGDAVIMSTTGLTLNNLTISGGRYGLLVNCWNTNAPLTQDVVLNDVNIVNSVRALNVTAYRGATTLGKALIVNGGQLAGKVSYAKTLTGVTFTNVEFVTNGGAKGDVLEPYGDTTLVGCTFAEGYAISTADLVDGCTITKDAATVAPEVDGYHWCESGVLTAVTSYEGKAPTCTEFGWAAYVECACGYTTYKKIPATGHSYEMVEGELVCSVCGNPAAYTIENIDGVDYLCDNGEPVVGGGIFMFDESTYYWTDYSGAIVKDRKVSVTGSDLLPDGVYYFGTDGKMTQSGIIVLNDVEYLYVDGLPVRDQVVEYEGAYYWTNSSGAIVKSDKLNLTGHATLADGVYYFGADGKMIWTGIFNIGGVDYLYVEGLPVRSQVYKMAEGEFYWTTASGALVKNKSVSVNNPEWGLNGSCYFGEDGKMWWTGLYERGGATYLYMNGAPVRGQIAEFEGNYYWTSSNGKLVVNKTINLKEGASILPAGKYAAGADGVLELVTD